MSNSLKTRSLVLLFLFATLVSALLLNSCTKTEPVSEPVSSDTLNIETEAQTVPLETLPEETMVVPDDPNLNGANAPVIDVMSQENLYYNLSTNSPEISFTLASPAEVAVTLDKIYVDAISVKSFIKEDNGVYTLSGLSFADGFHTVSLFLSSEAGDAFREFEFGCGACDDMQLYCGELHAHCSDSDGAGTASEAYTYARDVAKLDFFALTDHSNSFAMSKYLSEHIPLANEFNDPGKFVAFYGYEQTYNATYGYYGHLNTINSDVYSLNSLDLARYYKKMSAASGAIVQFNHPGYNWGNFLEYGLYSEKYDAVVNLYEFKGSAYDNEWALCLAKGWHVSPMHNEDNHSAQWGTVNEAVGYVLAPSLTRQNIAEALTAKRSYTTTDRTLKIYYSVNDTWLGGTLENPEELNITVKLSTEKSTGVGNVYIVAEDNIIVASKNVGNSKTYTWNLTLSPEYDYYYVKVDGSSGFAVTAPVWIEGRDKLNITDIDRSLIAYDNSSLNDHRVSVTVKNSSDAAMTDVKVYFYQTALSGFKLAYEAPFSLVEIGTLAAGEEKTVFADTAYLVTKPRISAIVSGKQGEASYSDTMYLQLNNLLITEICSNMYGYSFVELYNATDDAFNLSNYKIRLWPKTGAKADTLGPNTLSLSGTIGAHSTMVIWLKTDAAKNLKIADFNKKYNTQLESGKTIIELTSPWYAPATKGVQIEVLNGSTVITRTWYNFGTDKTDIGDGRSVTFTYQKDYTLTEVKAKTMQIPSPGTYDLALMPELILSK